MIIEIKIANYRSINAEQTLSFVAERGTRHKDNLIQRPGYRLMKAAGLFGANASGKSNFVRAIGEMRDFVRDSATKMNDGDPIICAQPYRLDTATQNAPSRFEITFVADGTVYTYGFAAYRGFVQEEWLKAKDEISEKHTLHFTRLLNIASGKYLWTFSPQIKPLTELFLDRTRYNALALSVAARENVKELLPIYRHLSHSVQVYDASSDIDTLVAHTAIHCEEDEDFRHQVEGLLGDADTGVFAFMVEYQHPIQLPPSIPNVLASPADIYKARSAALLVPPVQHIISFKRGKDESIVEFDFMRDESNGTQRFFGLAGVFLDALALGAFLVIDELDASMHPLLTRKLLELFQSPEANPNGAQLLFTTHDPSLLDQELFRRDQIWLAEKHAGASTFYSLADIKPPIRSTESFLRNYLTGRYGGTPHLGPAFDSVLAGAEA